ncbi:MAG TPA: L-threonylcarbamoyladenylate synthase [Anaeromyxobacteraceae bacterium]|nr:L-threonylcarbamoyladenylate synthase [Anaeromyxobacteraceae bacterium]
MTAPSAADLADRIRAAAAVLRRGGIVAYPTETFYGLGALAADGAAVERLTRAKERPDLKPLPLLAADLGQVEAVADLPPLARRLAAAFWPGPLTLVVPARPGLHPAITGGGATVGIRVTSGAVAARLALEAGGPLVATSANLSGEPPPASPAALAPALVARLDLVLDAGAAPGGLPSTVVAVEGDRLRLLRDGAVPFEAVEALRLAGA